MLRLCRFRMQLVFGADGRKCNTHPHLLRRVERRKKTHTHTTTPTTPLNTAIVRTSNLRRVFFYSTRSLLVFFGDRCAPTRSQGGLNINALTFCITLSARPNPHPHSQEKEISSPRTHAHIYTSYINSPLVLGGEGCAKLAAQGNDAVRLTGTPTLPTGLKPKISIATPKISCKRARLRQWRVRGVAFSSQPTQWSVARA